MKICAVIVTYNRLELLKICLEKYANQIRLPEFMVIVDNASTDGTREYLDIWKEKNQSKFDIIIIHSESNTGGSGGFYIGMEEAMKTSADWVWVSDDDAMPELDVFEKIERYISNSDEDLSAVCASVINEGKFDSTHRARRKKKFLKYKFTGVLEEEIARNEYISIDCFTYVGSMIKIEKILKCGNVNKDFFLWNDDTEHSWRLSEIGKIICLRDAKIHHNVPQIQQKAVSWKMYYGYRNELVMVKLHGSKHHYVLRKIVIAMKGVLDSNPDHFKISKAAIKDAKNNKLGVHEIYRPGWKSEYDKK